MEQDTFTVLVTGANSGLGYAICCRLIDEFLHTRPQSQNLHILFSTRDQRKSEATKKRLHGHLQKTLRNINESTHGKISLLLESRVKIEGVLVDLTKLITVKALAQTLVRRGQRLDSVICNAGVAGWLGTNWFKAIPEVMTGLIEATTAPEFMICDVGLLAKPQGTLSRKGDGKGEEPKLGQVFLSNVFGHYMLVHWLSPVLDGASRVIWISSISALENLFSCQDLQGLRSDRSYESSKRLTDLLVLTSDLPSTAPFTSTFWAQDSSQTSSTRTKTGARPKMYLTHPGVIQTSIADLHPIMSFLMLLSLYFARLLGSPWHPISPYKGAISAVYAALSPTSQLPGQEEVDGKGKWGSSTDVFGGERVARTEVDGWGFAGVVARVPAGSVAGRMGRRKGWREMSVERREEFEVEGREVWRDMEALRVEWEGRLGEVEEG
ncbi:3-keto-steroid reductase [Recurvomyces mirabilis]|nr:3-keto-steroid reductase [Recurvomyces mirabilis]